MYAYIIIFIKNIHKHEHIFNYEQYKTYLKIFVLKHESEDWKAAHKDLNFSLLFSTHISN